MSDLDELLRWVDAPEGGADDPLDLSSLQVITLVTHLEDTYRLRLSSADITRANFGSRRSLRVFLATKGIA